MFFFFFLITDVLKSLDYGKALRKVHMSCFRPHIMVNDELGLGIPQTFQSVLFI